MVREFYRAETVHCKKMVRMWQGFQTDMCEVEQHIQDGMALDSMMLDVFGKLCYRMKNGISFNDLPQNFLDSRV